MTTTAALLSPQQIIDAGLAASRADGCVVIVQVRSEANVRWANNTATTSGFATGLDWFVVSVQGRAAAAVSGSAADASSAGAVAGVVAAAEAAAAAAGASGPAQDAMPLVEGGADDGFSGEAAATEFAVFGGLLDRLAGAMDAARSGERILYGFARHEITTTYLGSSTGLRRRWVQPTGTLEVNAKSADLTRSSWAGTWTPDFADVDVAAMADSLGQRLDWARRRVELPPGRYDTVLPPTAVADFLVYLAWSAGARPAHEGRSVFAAAGGTKIGERITERPLSLYADPAEHGMECAPFLTTAHSSETSSVFDNGAPIGRISTLRDGAISQLIQTRASALEYGAAFTPAADNLLLVGGDETRTTADLVAGVDRGLLVTSQWYLREVDPMTLLLTGLTRDGVFLIERGEIVGAVNNFRFNMSPLDVLRHGVDVGRTERALSREWSDWFTRSAMPPIRVEGFHMSSVSQAQ
jgi:predicted Zn-dependent protease